MIKKTVTILTPILVGFFLIYIAYSQFSPEQIQNIKAQFSKADYLYIYISLVIATIGYLSRAYRWLFCLNHMGYDVPFKNSLITVCISYLVNLTIPRSGEITRAVLLTKTDQVPFQAGFGSIIAERIIDFAILLFICLLGFLFNIDLILEIFKEKTASLQIIVFILLFLVLIFGILFYFFKKSKWAFFSKIKEKIKGFSVGIQSIVKLKTKKEFILHTLLIWACYLTMFYVTIFTFPETSQLTFPQVITAFIAGTFAIVLTNGGFGAYPLLISKVLFLYGIPETIGTSFGWILWASQIVLTLLLGGLSFVALPFSLRRKRD